MKTPYTGYKNGVYLLEVVGVTARMILVDFINHKATYSILEKDHLHEELFVDRLAHEDPSRTITYLCEGGEALKDQLKQAFRDEKPIGFGFPLPSYCSYKVGECVMFIGHEKVSALLKDGSITTYLLCDDVYAEIYKVNADGTVDLMVGEGWGCERQNHVPNISTDDIRYPTRGEEPWGLPEEKW